MTLYHFTSMDHFESMVNGCEFIRTTESNVGSPIRSLKPFGVNVGPPVVWLLDTTDFKASHGLSRRKREVMIEISPIIKVIRWLDWAPAERMHPQWKAGFIDAGGGMEAAGHWYVFPGRIRRDQWTGVTFL